MVYGNSEGRANEEQEIIMRHLISFSILLTFALLFLPSNFATAIYSSEATEISYQVTNSDRIVVGTVSGIDTSNDYTITTITVSEWLYNPLPTKTIQVMTIVGLEDEVDFIQNESVLLMLKDKKPDNNMFLVFVGSLGKHPVLDRDTIIKELKTQGKLKGENQAGTNTNETKELTFGSETLDILRKDSDFIAAYGNMPVFSTSEERRQWIDILCKIVNKVNANFDQEMSTYFYPNGSVTGYGITIDGVIQVGINKSITVDKPFMDEIYQIFNSKASEMGIKEVPVVFMHEDNPIPAEAESSEIDSETANSLTSKEENSRELNNSNNRDSDNIGSSGEGNSSAVRYTPGFELLGSLACLYIGWKLRRK